MVLLLQLRHDKVLPSNREVGRLNSGYESIRLSNLSSICFVAIMSAIFDTAFHLEKERPRISPWTTNRLI